MPELKRKCLFVVGRQRSGTTVLRKTLATHPKVHDLGEVMHPGHQNGFYANLRDRLSESLEKGVHNAWIDILFETIENLTAQNDPDQWHIVDIKYNMANAFGHAYRKGAFENLFIDRLRQEGIPVLQIIRRNKIELLTSEKLAIKTNQWELSPGTERSAAQIHLSPVLLGARIAKEEALDNEFRKQLIGARTFEVIYENLFDRNGSMNGDYISGIADMMGLDHQFDRTPRLLKQGRELHESLSNYDAVRQAVDVMVNEKYIDPLYKLPERPAA